MSTGLTEVANEIRRMNSNLGGFRDEMINQLIDAHNTSAEKFSELIGIQRRAEEREEARGSRARRLMEKHERQKDKRERDRETKENKDRQKLEARNKNIKPDRANRGEQMATGAARSGIFEGLFGVGLMAAGVVAALSTGLIAILNRYNQIFGEDEGLLGSFNAISGFLAAPAITSMITNITRIGPTLARLMGPISLFVSKLPLVGNMFKMLGRVSGIFTIMVGIFDGFRMVDLVRNGGADIIGPAELFAAFFEGFLTGFISLFGDIGHLFGGMTESLMRFFGFSDERSEQIGNAVRGFFNLIENALMFLVDLFEPIMSLVADLFSEIRIWGNFVSEMFGGFIDGLGDFIDDMRDNDIMGPIIRGLESVWNGITNFFGKDGPIGSIIENATGWLSRFGISLPDNWFERRTVEEQNERAIARANRRAERRLARNQREQELIPSSRSMGRNTGEFMGRPDSALSIAANIRLPAPPGSRPMDVTGWSGFEDSGLRPARRIPTSEQVQLISIGQNSRGELGLSQVPYEPAIRSQQIAMASERIATATEEVRDAQRSAQNNMILAPTDNSRTVSVTNNSAPVFAGRGSSVNPNDPAVRSPTSY